MFSFEVLAVLMLVSFFVLLLAGIPVALTLADGASVDDVLSAIRSLVPGRGLPPALMAVNQEYASPGQLLSDGDEVAIIPPVAGG